MGLNKAILLANLFRNVDTDEDTEYHLSDMSHILVVESYCYSGWTALVSHGSWCFRITW
jgi:hypothetical protein